MTFGRVVALGVAVLIVSGLLAACGSSSKPAYCADVTNFKNAVDQLKDTSGPSALITQIKKVASTGQTAVGAVKGSFSAQTSAVKTSLAALETSAKQLTSSSTRATALAAIPSQVKAAQTAGENLVKAAQAGKCG